MNSKIYSKYVKRVLDFFIALLFMPFLCIIIIIIAPMIYITDPGPIFYDGFRRGINGKPFKMYKFRSMYVNSPDIRNKDGSTYNADKDPRVTKIGAFLRKTSIDELPQLINVLFGDMSFVGPRPTLATKSFDEIDKWRRKCYDVRPGVTGYTQAYYRNSIPSNEKFKHDLYYVDHVSFLFDVKIIFKTLVAVLKRENINTVHN